MGVGRDPLKHSPLAGLFFSVYNKKGKRSSRLATNNSKMFLHSAFMDLLLVFCFVMLSVVQPSFLMSSFIKCLSTKLQAHTFTCHTVLCCHAVLVPRAPCAFEVIQVDQLLILLHDRTSSLSPFCFTAKQQGRIRRHRLCSFLFDRSASLCSVTIGRMFPACMSKWVFMCHFQAHSLQAKACAGFYYTLAFASVSSTVSLECISSPLSPFQPSGFIQTDSWINKPLWAEPPIV